MTLKRFGVSIPEELLKDFDNLVEKKGYIGRSEAIRDALRLYISETEWETGNIQVIASLNIVYCHKPKLMAELVKVQHSSEANVISTMHVHLSRAHCLEVITVEGSKAEVTKLANKVAGISGIEYAKLFTFALPDIEPEHKHTH